MDQLCSSSRFRILAEHFQKMYPNLNINIDTDLEQLKVGETKDKDIEYSCLLTDFWTFFLNYL